MVKHTSAGNLKCKVMRVTTAYIGKIFGNLFGSIVLPEYTAQELHNMISEDNLGKIVMCSDGNHGTSCLARFNGVSWKIIAIEDGIISSID